MTSPPRLLVRAAYRLMWKHPENYEKCAVYGPESFLATVRTAFHIVSQCDPILVERITSEPWIFIFVSYNLGASAIYALTPSLNLMLECVANFDEGLDDAGGRDRSVSVLLSPGLRYGIDLPNDAQFVVGIAAPIGLTGDAPDYGIFLYASFEHFFQRAEQSPISGRGK